MAQTMNILTNNMETKRNKRKDLDIFNDEFDEFTQETTVSETEVFNSFISTLSDNMITEAILHFSKRFRKQFDDDYDERYFYSYNEVSEFLKGNHNPEVKIKAIYEKKRKNQIEMYIAYRTVSGYMRKEFPGYFDEE